jgi:hypothetical protein
MKIPWILKNDTETLSQNKREDFLIEWSSKMCLNWLDAIEFVTLRCYCEMFNPKIRKKLMHLAQGNKAENENALT